MSGCTWLPPAALSGPALRAAIEDSLGGWIADWFPGGLGLRISSLEPFIAGRSAHVGTVTANDNGCAVAIAMTPSSLDSLRSKALGMRRDSRPENEAEKIVLAGFEKRLIKALASRVETALKIETTASPQASPQQASSEHATAICAVISDRAGVEILRLTIPLEHAARFRKSCLPAPRRREPPASLSSAIGRSRLKLCGRLGTAELSLNELSGLTLGDVLVLDRRVDEPVDLLADCEMIPFARAQLDSAEHITVIVQ